jgi:hypothetical protein
MRTNKNLTTQYYCENIVHVALLLYWLINYKVDFNFPKKITFLVDHYSNTLIEKKNTRSNKNCRRKKGQNN